MSETEADDFVEGSEPDEDPQGSTSPHPLCGLSVLFSPSRHLQTSNLTDKMSPEIPKLVSTSYLSYKANQMPISDKENFSRRKEERLEQTMFSDSDSCASEVIVPLNHSLLQSVTQPNTLAGTMQATEQENPLFLQTDGGLCRDDGSETTIGDYCNNDKRIKSDNGKYRSPSRRLSKADEASDCGKSIQSVGGSSYGSISKKQRATPHRFSQRILDKSLSDNSQETTANNTDNYTPKGKSNTRAFESNKRNPSYSRNDRSETTPEKRCDNTRKSTRNKPWSPKTSMEKVDESSDCGKSVQSDGRSSGIGGKEQKVTGQRFSKRVLNKNSKENSRESVGKNSQNRASKRQSQESTFIESRNYQMNLSSINKNQSFNDFNRENINDNVSVVSSQNSHLSDETIDPTATQRMTQPKTRSRNVRSLGSFGKKAGNPTIQQQTKFEDSYVEASESQSLIEPPKSEPAKKGFVISSSQSSGSSCNSDAKVKAKEEKFRVHHDLELELIKKVEKHQASAKDVLGRKSIDCAGKVQSLLVSLAPLMEQLKKAHCHERQHIAREKEKNLNEAEQSLLKLQITLFVERARRLVTVYQQHTELTKMVKQLREEAQQKKFSNQNHSKVKPTEHSQKRDLPSKVDSRPFDYKKTSDEKPDLQHRSKKSLEPQASKKRPIEQQSQEKPSKKKCTKPERDASRESVFTPPFRQQNMTKTIKDDVSKIEYQGGIQLDDSKPARSEPSDDGLSLELCGRTQNSEDEPDDNSNGAPEDDASVDFVLSNDKDDRDYTTSNVSDGVNTFQKIGRKPQVSNKDSYNRNVPLNTTVEEPDIIEVPAHSKDGLRKEDDTNQNISGSGFGTPSAQLNLGGSRKENAIVDIPVTTRTVTGIQTNHNHSNIAREQVVTVGQSTLLRTLAGAVQRGNTCQVYRVSDPNTNQIHTTVGKHMTTNSGQAVSIVNIGQRKVQKTQVYAFTSPTVGAKDKTAENMSFGSPYSSIYGSTICPTQESINKNTMPPRHYVQEKNTISLKPQSVQQNHLAKMLSEDPVSNQYPKTQVVPSQSASKPKVLYLTPNQTIHVSNQQGIRHTGSFLPSQTKSISIQNNTGQIRGTTANNMTVIHQDSSSNHFNPNQMQSIVGVNKASVTKEIMQQQKKTVPPQLPVLPDLCQLLAARVISPGNRVLTLESKSKVFNASLTESGWIRGEGGEIFRTPMAWFKAVIPEAHKLVVTKKMAYPKVHYQGVPLSEFELPSSAATGTAASAVGATPHGSSSTSHQVRTGTLKQASGSTLPEQLPTKSLLSRLLGRCKVAIHTDDELVRNRGWLPDNFWTEPDFNKVDLPDELVAEIDCW